MATSGFTSELFDLYAPDKWASNVHNLKRMQAKTALLALVDSATTTFHGSFAGLQRGSSDEIPNINNQKKVDAQWIYWYRDAAGRDAIAFFLDKTALDKLTIFNIAPTDKHVTLAIIVRHIGVDIQVRVPPGAVVDQRNLAAKIDRSWDRQQLEKLLAELLPDASIGFERNPIACTDLSVELLTDMAAETRNNKATWFVGYHIARENALAQGCDIGTTLSAMVDSLLPLYRYIAWTRDNDAIEVTKHLQEEKAQKRKNSTQFQPGDKVLIVTGLFRGKTGIVQETDTKAQVKVNVGAMSVVVAGGDLAPASVA